MRRAAAVALACLALALALGACGEGGRRDAAPASVAPTTMEVSTVRLVILKAGWDELGLGYEAGPALARLRTAPLEPALFTLEVADLAAYRSGSHAFVLTPEGTARLIAALAATPDARLAGVRKLAALKAKLGMGNAVGRALYTRAFVVLAGAERVYGGIFLDAPSQMAIDFPVARVAAEDERLVLRMLPLHLPFFESDPGAAPAPRADDGAGYGAPSGMIDAFRSAAASPLAVENRALLDDPRLRAALERAGKLE
ncbi:MAG: hypothetical protein HY908_30425 [Myxococcales bacterium]|nr:hypothetical protein [Myxococcales bacterium]